MPPATALCIDGDPMASLPSENPTIPSSQTISREQLYEAVWSTPATHLAARFGVSDSFLARICKRLRVPRPQPGYWAKLAVGKAPPKPALAPAEPGDETHWEFSSALSPQRHVESNPTLSKQAQPSETAIEAVPTQTSPSQASPAPSTPSSDVAAPRKAARRRVPATHPLIEGVIGLIPQGRVTDEGFYRPRKRLLPDIITSEKQLETILRLANKLYRHLEACGHRVRISTLNSGLHHTSIDPTPPGKKSGTHVTLWQPERPTVVYFDDVAIGLSLFETLREREMQYVGGEYIPVTSVSPMMKQQLGWASWSTTRLVPSGEFCLQAYSPYPSTDWVHQWRGTTSALSSQFDEITQTLQNAIPTITALIEQARLAAEKWQREWEESRERERREAQAKRRAKAIETARTELLAIIDDWDQYQRISAFFNEILTQSEGISEASRLQILHKLAAAEKLFGGADTLARLAQWQPPHGPEADA